MGKHSLPDSKMVISSNHEMLASIVGNIDEARQATIHHYHKSFRGFSARLTPKHVDQIKKIDSVVSIFESKLLELHTTRSWDFMDATSNSIFSKFSVQEKYDNVIIGHFDSGVWPESPSFNPEGLGPVPSRFRGECEAGEQFSVWNCNRKIIGARYYYQGYEEDSGPLAANGNRYFLSPRDDFGHGSHTASTAAGSLVNSYKIPNVLETQTARGGSPNARLAVYKVCWFNLCSSADVFKAFDDAIDDNVDIITISAGPKFDKSSMKKYSYVEDMFTVGAFHAFMRGILTCASAGNLGEFGASSVVNSAPWVVTVGASYDDRNFPTLVELGNGVTLEGFSINRNQINDFTGLIAAISAAMFGVPIEAARYCKRNALDSELIEGKIVICTMESWDDDTADMASVVSDGGGVGMIVIDPNDQKPTDDYDIHVSVINSQEAKTLHNYLISTREPVARIAQTRALFNSKPAPRMAHLSSKGPDRLTPDIIKPDITAPGMNILAAWHAMNYDNWDYPSFNFDSGTSMSCPHVAGVAAMIKALHPTWSPAEIKSALMTSALQLDNTGKPIQSSTGGSATPFELGSGHLYPNAALDPGLVYDMNAEDIFMFVCNKGITQDLLQKLFGTMLFCPFPPLPAYNLNLPSIGINNLVGKTTVSRKVTYRGQNVDPMVFQVQIEHPRGIDIEVNPSVLDFSNGQQTLTFSVDVSVRKPLGRFVFGSITWFNEVHRVRSPIAIKAM
ncbi:hypothetical protein CsSME_00016780 [Camellia sinensis var. sinensis]